MQDAEKHERWKPALWFEPTILATMIIGFFLITPPPNETTDLGEAYEQIGAFLLPVLTQALPVFAIVSTVIVSIAVLTRFGLDGHLLHQKLHQVVTTMLIVMFFLVLLIAACCVRIAVSDGRKWPETVIVIVVAWLLSLAARLAWGRTSLHALANDATQQLRAQEARARGYGLTGDSAQPKTSLKGAALVLLVPLSACAVVWFTAFTIPTTDTPDVWRGFALPLYATFSPIIMVGVALSWWVLRDRSLTRSAAAFTVLPPATLAIVAGALLALSVALTAQESLWWFRVGIVIAAIVAAQVLFLLIRPLRRLVPSIRDAENAATISSLKLAALKAEELRGAAATQGANELAPVN